MLEKGLDKEARPYSSMAKNHVANLLCDVLDDAIQMHGPKPIPIWLGGWGEAAFARAARIADGPDEVHLVTLARDYLLGRFEVLV